MNAGSVDYHYIAFNDAAGKIDVNFYPGNSTDGTNITGVGFQPEFVVIQDYLSTQDLHFKSDQMAGDSAVSNRGALATNHIQDLISDGFQVGDANNVNETGKNYAYVAFNITDGGGAGQPPPLVTARIRALQRWRPAAPINIWINLPSLPTAAPIR
jgi:hypothetical protein